MTLSVKSSTYPRSNLKKYSIPNCFTTSAIYPSLDAYISFGEYLGFMNY